MSAAPSESSSPPARRSRRRILEAAGRCLAAQGFGKTTVEQIASTAGVSKVLVYHHFRGKQEILEAVLEDTLADWERLTRAGPLVQGGRAGGGTRAKESSLPACSGRTARASL
ncbi:MAG: helix-turn-helix domain-containing protein [Myxococcota bacterium]